MGCEKEFMTIEGDRRRERIGEGIDGESIGEGMRGRLELGVKRRYGEYECKYIRI